MSSALDANPSPPAPAAGKPARTVSVAVVGATGAVGQELLELLAERSFPYSTVKLLASARSAGKKLNLGGQQLTVEELTAEAFDGVDIALFSAGGSISKKFAPIAAQAGAVVIDNSSAFRMDPACPLVVPEVNPEAMADVKLGAGTSGGGASGAIIANPNCSTIIALMATTAIHRAAGVRRMVVSTYQAASGAGAAAMAELETQTREALDGKPADQWTQEIFGRPYAFNLFSHNSDLGDDGLNTEETKMVRETHKIWADQKTPEGKPRPLPGRSASGRPASAGRDSADEQENTGISATCIRVPVMRAHAESINLTLDQPLSADQARELLAGFPGVSIVDDRTGNRFPTPLDASGKDDVLVGRLREDRSQPAGHGLDLFCCGDQIRKGAALNAIQIAEMLVGH
ncbi:MAG: aspartate-semialdehyde dehydrogenase [Planctomycetota bacterium]